MYTLSFLLILLHIQVVVIVVIYNLRNFTTQEDICPQHNVTFDQMSDIALYACVT